MPDVLDDIKGAIKDGFSQASSTVQRHTSEILSSEMQQFGEDVKKFTGSAIGTASSVAKSALQLGKGKGEPEEQQVDELKKVNETLKDPTPKAGLHEKLDTMETNIVGAITGQTEEQQKADAEQKKANEATAKYFEDQKKALARQVDPKKKKGMLGTILAAALFTIGAVVGAVAGLILAPFRLLWAVLKGIKPLALGIKKAVTWIKSFKLFQWLDDLFKSVAKIMPKSLVKGLKFGFKKLFWPLQIIVSVIDFIEGFMGTEGTIIEKIKGGLWKVIEGFIKLPVKLFGWLADWVLELFGIEIEGGAASKIMEGIKWLFDKWWGMFTWFWGGVFNKLKDLWGILEMAGEWISEVWEQYGIGKMIKGLIGKFLNFVKNMIITALDYFIEEHPIVAKALGATKIRDWLSEQGPTPAEEKERLEKEKQRELAKREEERKKLEEERLAEQQRLAEEQARANEINTAAVTSMNTGGRVERDPDPVPDETDNNVLGLALMGMA